MTATWRMVALAALVGVGACSSATQGTATRSSRNVITAEEVEATEGTRTAMDVIRRLRPAWLTRRGVGAEPVVYVDNLRQGGTSALNQIFVENIQEMRFMSASDATTRFGTGHDGGAIEVITKR